MPPADERPPLAQCASTVLMIRPAAFGSNPETAASNAFQSTGLPGPRDREFALAEFDGAAAALERAGVEVIVVDDIEEPPRPDAVFPNNWISLHHDGTVALYPMLSPLRRHERRRDVVALLESRGFGLRRVLDLSGWESDGLYLEGTGSMVLDHRLRLAYVAESPRSSPRPLARFCEELGYVPRLFHAAGPDGEPVYHSNVVMCIGEGFAAACLAAVGDAAQRRRLEADLRQGERELLVLQPAQMNCFAGNMLALRTTGGQPVVALSAAAWQSLDAAQRRLLERQGSVVTAPLPTIERVGGGSLRCMLAEVFLPRTAMPGLRPG